MTRKEEAIKYLRKAADILEKTKETIHLPDDIIYIEAGYFNTIDRHQSGQDIVAKEIGAIVRYFADMMED